MVSFFGLKLGGDKKKKGDKSVEALKDVKPLDRNALGEGQFFGTSLNKSALLLDNPASIPRPDTAASNRSMGGLRKPKAPYAWAGASSSMVDLSASPAAQYHATKPSGGGNSLRHMGGSEANLRTRWNNGSSTSLVPPNKTMFGTASTPSGPDGRPGTAGSQRTKAWVNPLDVHFGRDGSFPSSRPTTSNGANPPPPLASASPSGAPQLPKSPLGNTFEFSLAPMDTNKGQQQPGLAEGKREDMTPSPLYQVRSRSPPSPKSYPSPPQSVKDLEPPRMRVDTNVRSPSKQRQGSANNKQHPPRGGQGSADSLPSPATSVPRSSDEKPWSGPVIQNVRAKRETLTINGPRRQSFSMDVEEANRQMPEPPRPEPTRRPGTAGNGSPPPRSTRRPRPPPTEDMNHTRGNSNQQQGREISPPAHDEPGQWRPQPAAAPGQGRNGQGQHMRDPSPAEPEEFDFDQWNYRPSPQEYATHTGNPYGRPEEPSYPSHDDPGQWRHRGPSPYDERENRFQAPVRPFQQESHQLRDSSPYRRGPRRPDYPEGDMRPGGDYSRPPEHHRPPPQMAAPDPRGRAPYRQDRGDARQGPRPRPPPPQGRPDEFSPPNRPAQGGPPAPRPPPEGQYRIANRPPREESDARPFHAQRREAPEAAYISPVSDPEPDRSWEPGMQHQQQQAWQHPAQHQQQHQQQSWQHPAQQQQQQHQQHQQQQQHQAAQGPAQGHQAPPQAAADPNHPSKGPQDFNVRPGFGQSSAKRRGPPPRLNPAPPPLRLRRDLDSPAPLESPALPPSDRQNLPVNPITSAKFNEPRQAPSPPSTAATSFHMPSSPLPQSQLQPPPPLPDSKTTVAESPRKPLSPTKPGPVMASQTPDLVSNPNWPLVDSGPPSAAFTVQSPEGASSYGGSKPTSPAGMPLASPAFGTFAIGSNSPGPSHWNPNPPAWVDDKRNVDRSREAPPLQRERFGGGSAPVRPDYGLRAPTGIADEFQVKFI